MKLIRPAALLLGVAALALPAGAAAKGGHGNRHAGHAHAKHERSGDRHGGAGRRTFVFRGTWQAGSLQVTSGNRHVRRAGLVGQSVAFDLAKARVVVDDVDGDGSRTLADVQDGDRVLIQARAGEGDSFVARKLVDRTHAPSADDEEGDDADDDGAEAEPQG